MTKTQRPIIDKQADSRMLELLRDLSAIVAAFQERFPDVDGRDIVAIIGGCAGACISSSPNAVDRETARQSVILTMDRTIKDFAAVREGRAELAGDGTVLHLDQPCAKTDPESRAMDGACRRCGTHPGEACPAAIQ